jgi:hypothetical protein
MTDKKTKAGKAGAVELAETGLSYADLDKVQGGRVKYGDITLKSSDAVVSLDGKGNDIGTE